MAPNQDGHHLVPHYSGTGADPLDLIESQGLNFHEGNIVKYVSRWRRKGGSSDLRKAKFYLDRLIEAAVEEEKEKEINSAGEID